jgi:hypothetical protein
MSLDADDGPPVGTRVQACHRDLHRIPRFGLIRLVVFEALGRYRHADTRQVASVAAGATANDLGRAGYPSDAAVAWRRFGRGRLRHRDPAQHLRRGGRTRVHLQRFGRHASGTRAMLEDVCPGRRGEDDSAMKWPCGAVAGSLRELKAYTAEGIERLSINGFRTEQAMRLSQRELWAG